MSSSCHTIQVPQPKLCQRTCRRGISETLSRQQWEQVVGSTQEGTLVAVLGETMTPLSSGINRLTIRAKEGQVVQVERVNIWQGSDMLPSLLILALSKSRTVPPKPERGITNHFNHLFPFANKLMPLGQFTADFVGLSPNSSWSKVG